MENQQEEKKGNRGLLFVLIGLLAASIGGNVYQGVKNKECADQVQVVTVEKEKLVSGLTADKDSLAADLTAQIARYDSLFANNEEAKKLLGDEKARVEALLKDLSKVKKGNTAELLKYKSEIDGLRKRQDELLARVADLEKANTELTDANLKLDKDLTQQKGENTNLKDENSRLANTVDVASRLRTFGVISEGIRVKRSGKEVETAKAKRSNRIQSCFNLLANPVAKAGNRTLYMVVKDPSGQILTEGLNNTFRTEEGTQQVYSSKKEIIYEGDAKNYCLGFNKEDMPKGTYQIELFCDGYSIGTTSTVLK